MKKFLSLVSGYLFLTLVAGLGVGTAVRYTNLEYANLVRSLVDATPIGSSIPSTGSFTTLFSNTFGVNSAPSSLTGNSAGYLGWGKNSTGDMDFFAANSGSSPSFYWYYLLGGSLTPEMWLDQSAVLHVPSGVLANVTGNVIGNVTGNVSGSSGSSSGNAATASSFLSTPTNCGNGVSSYGVAANGNALCNTTALVQYYNITTGICTTANTAYAECQTSTYNWPTAFADTNYGVACTTNVPSSSSGGSTVGTINVYLYARTNSTFTLYLQNGTGNGAGANTVSFISCVGSHL